MKEWLRESRRYRGKNKTKVRATKRNWHRDYTFSIESILAALPPSFDPSMSVSTVINGQESCHGNSQEGNNEKEGKDVTWTKPSIDGGRGGETRVAERGEDPKPQQHIIKMAPHTHVSTNPIMNSPSPPNPRLRRDTQFTSSSNFSVWCRLSLKHQYMKLVHIRLDDCVSY